FHVVGVHGGGIDGHRLDVLLAVDDDFHGAAARRRLIGGRGKLLLHLGQLGQLVLHLPHRLGVLATHHGCCSSPRGAGSTRSTPVAPNSSTACCRNGSSRSVGWCASAGTQRSRQAIPSSARKTCSTARRQSMSSCIVRW